MIEGGARLQSDRVSNTQWGEVDGLLKHQDGGAVVLGQVSKNREGAAAVPGAVETMSLLRAAVH